LGVGGDARNLTTSIYSGAGGISAAVNAPVRIRKVNVVKYVVELKLELSLRPFRYGKVFEQGQVRIEVPWPTQGVATNTPEGVHRRLCP
jgi:hypothetical protein